MVQSGGQASKKQKPEIEAPKERKNTAVYVTSLPLDTDMDEIHTVFSKYGVIAESLDSDAPRIKMYTDDKGKFKGEALIGTYALKPHVTQQLMSQFTSGLSLSSSQSTCWTRPTFVSVSNSRQGLCAYEKPKQVTRHRRTRHLQTRKRLRRKAQAQIEIARK